MALLEPFDKNAAVSPDFTVISLENFLANFGSRRMQISTYKFLGLWISLSLKKIGFNIEKLYYSNSHFDFY